MRPSAVFPMMLKTQQTLFRLLEWSTIHVECIYFSSAFGEPFTCAGGRKSKDTGHFEEVDGIGVNEN